jgi:hypothetical protein
LWWLLISAPEEYAEEAAFAASLLRTLRLGRRFDAVFVHDAVDYMTTEADLRRAVSTAYEHCREGGLAVFVPDDIAENFEPGTEHGGHDAPDGRGVRYLEWWSSDPDPGDTRTRSEFAFLLREADGSVQVAHDTHEFGLFPRALWLKVLTEVWIPGPLCRRHDNRGPPSERALRRYARLVPGTDFRHSQL